MTDNCAGYLQEESMTQPFDGSADQRRGVWRSMDLIHNGQRFLARRGVDIKAFGIYVHRIDRPDPGMDLHDHPWPFISIVLWGSYTEQVIDSRNAPMVASLAEQFPDTCKHGLERTWRRGSVHRIRMTEAHRITDVAPHTVTLVFRGRRTRAWGFYPPYGFDDFRTYDYAERRPVEVRGA